MAGVTHVEGDVIAALAINPPAGNRDHLQQHLPRELNPASVGFGDISN
jgi:hypothetical protein